MAEMSTEDQAKLIEAIRQSQIDNYFSLASIIILYYDYTLTLPDEIRYFWKRTSGRKRIGSGSGQLLAGERLSRLTSWRRWFRTKLERTRTISTVAVLFYLNRYLPIGLGATILVHNLGVVSIGVSSYIDYCKVLNTIDQVLLLTIQIIVCVVTATRTYAVYERSPFVWWIFFVIFWCGLGVSMWAILGTSHELETVHVPDRFGCKSPLSDKRGKRIAIAWIVLMIYDFIVFSLTLYKAIQIWRHESSRLFRILIRDGAIFFFVMTMANLSNVFVLMLAPPFLKDACTTFTSTISVTMISRLMLNILNPRLLEEPSSGNCFVVSEVEDMEWIEEDMRFHTSSSGISGTSEDGQDDLI